MKVSGDGRYVAFESAAKNLVANDTNKHSDVFRRGPLDEAPQGGWCRSLDERAMAPPSLQGRTALGCPSPLLEADAVVCDLDDLVRGARLPCYRSMAPTPDGTWR